MLLINGMSLLQLLDVGTPPEQVVTELKATLAGAVTLSDDEERDTDMLRVLAKGAGNGFFHLSFEDFHDMAWRMAPRQDPRPKPRFRTPK